VGNGDVSMVVKCQGHEAEHSPSSSAGVKNAWSCTSTSLPHVLMM
jgi:hypothetical protein